MKKLLLFTLFAFASHSLIMQASQPNQQPGTLSQFSDKALIMGISINAGLLANAIHRSMVHGQNTQGPANNLSYASAIVAGIAAGSLVESSLNPQAGNMENKTLIEAKTLLGALFLIAQFITL